MIKGLKLRDIEVGKIKIGGKGAVQTSAKGNQYQQPEKWDHFVVTQLDRDATGNLRKDDALTKKLAAKVGSLDGKLREIPIAFLSDDLEQVFPTAYVAYAGKKRVATSDGETITWFSEEKSPGQWTPLDTPKIKPNINHYVETATTGSGSSMTRLFKPHGTLNCVITDGDARWGGVYRFRTTSIITIEQIVSGLTHIQELTRGFLRNVPIRLVVRPLQVAPEGKPTTVYVVHVEMRGTDLVGIQRSVVEAAQAEMATGRQLNAIRREYLALAAAPGDADESDEEQAEVAEEFHPETVAPAAAAPDPLTGEVALSPAAAGILERLKKADTRAKVGELMAEIQKAKEEGLMPGTEIALLRVEYAAARKRNGGDK